MGVKKLNFAVCGVGKQGTLWAKRVHSHGETNLVAVTDINENKSFSVAKQLGVRTYSNLEELFKRRMDEFLPIPTGPSVYPVAAPPAMCYKRRIRTPAATDGG